MIVSNIITVTFLVIIGTTFVISATQLDKQGLELKPKVIRRRTHEKNSSDVLLDTLSDFGVVRRSLSPVLIERYSIHFAKDKRHVSKNNNKLKNVIEKLKASVTFRDNILYIFSYLLYGRKTGFTEEQYTSLQILYEFLKKKTVYMYNLLPILSRLSYMDKNQQTGIILLSLIKNLPPYLRCTARFLANEIEQERIDLNILLSQTTSETFNYLANINLNILRGKLKIVGDEMKGYDKYSNITQKALGPVFVTLLYNLHEHKLSLSQELFGLILINLPNPNDDPVLEENIRYLYDLTKNNVIDHRNWDLIGEDPVPISSDAYTLVFSVLSKILVSNVGMVVKNAAAYVYHHLRLVMTPTYDNPNMMYLHRLLKQNIDIGMLFSAIVPQEFGPDAIRLKDRLVTYFMHNYRNEDLNKILNGFNKFAYRDPLDLLVAFLTRLVNRIQSFPNTNLQIIQQSATALLSTLIVKKSTRIFMPFVSPEIDVLILIESLKIPDIDPAFQSTIDSIKLELISQPHISVLVSTLLPTEKHNCLIPIQCLMSTFQNIQRLQNNLPVTLITNIQTIAYILKTRLTQLQNYFIPQFFVDTGIVYFNVSDYEIRQTKKTQKVPNSLNESLYGWNLNNYYNMTPVKQVGLLETTRRQTTEKNKQTTKEMESNINTESTKTKVESSTITTNEAQVTEHVKSNIPSQENLSEQLLTSSLATTSTSYDSSEITNKPLRKQKKKQPLLWMSGIPTDIDEKTNVGFLNTKEEENSSQPNKPLQKQKKKQPLLWMSGVPTDIDEKTNVGFLNTKEEENSSQPNKPLQKQKKKQPLLWMSGIPTDIDEKTNVGFLNTKEEENSSQPNTSEESESQTYSLEETDKDITTKSTRLATTIRKNVKRKSFTQKSSPQKTTNTEKLTTTTTVLPSSIEPNVTKKQESNLGFSHTKEEEISSQSNTSEEIESQTYSLEEVNKDVTTKQPTQSEKTIRKNKKEETSLPQKTTNASEKVTTIVLPPSIEPNEPLKIQLTDSGVPIITPDDHNKTVPGLVLPQITELVKPANINDLFSNNNTPIVTQILQPLSGIFGKNYIKKILQDVNINVYSTNIALLLAILKKATTYQQVTSNTNLMNLIQKYITTIEYVSPTILLPIVVSSKKLVSEVVYSTFNPHDLTYGGISEKPPVEASPDTITIPLVNPKIWLQSINPSDPYADLLPTLEKESVLAILIQPLKNILTSKKIVELLGPDFQPLVYPNKGALLITLLQKLRKVKTIQLDSDLKSLIDMYIYAIEIPSMNIQVSEDNFVKMMSETTGQWQPELTSLIVALPTVKSSAEAAMIRQIEHLLADPTLLEKLHITKPSSTMSRGELLHKIILSALSGKTHLKKQVLKAFRYYKDKVEFTDMGALPIMWMWIETYVVKAEVNLGSMIQQTVDFNQLTYKEKVAYNDLITYLAQNPNLLQDNENFEFQKYKTQGQFIKGLFKHLLTKPQINNKIKKNIQKLLSRVMLTGPGAIAIPTLSEF